MSSLFTLDGSYFDGQYMNSTYLQEARFGLMSILAKAKQSFTTTSSNKDKMYRCNVCPG